MSFGSTCTEDLTPGTGISVPVGNSNPIPGSGAIVNLSGTHNLLADLLITESGTPVLNEEREFIYNGTLTNGSKGARELKIFGQAIPVALYDKKWKAKFKYNGSAWNSTLEVPVEMVEAVYQRKAYHEFDFEASGLRTAYIEVPFDEDCEAILIGVTVSKQVAGGPLTCDFQDNAGSSMGNTVVATATLPGVTASISPVANNTFTGSTTKLRIVYSGAAVSAGVVQSYITFKLT